MKTNYLIVKSDRLKSPVLESIEMSYSCMNMAILNCGKLNAKAHEDIYYYIKKVEHEEESTNGVNFDFDLSKVFYQDSKKKRYFFDVEVDENTDELVISYCDSDIESLKFTKPFLKSIRNTIKEFLESRE